MAGYADEDYGGAVYPIEWCPHVQNILRNKEEQERIMANLPGFAIPTACCECGLTTENWLCLTTGKTLCSRYQNKHSILHFEEAKRKWEQTKSNTDSSVVGTDEEQVLKCCIYLSYSDLSVWCHACESYVKNPRLLPILIHAESYKFGTPPKLDLLDDRGNSSSSSMLGKIREDEEEGDGAGF